MEGPIRCSSRTPVEFAEAAVLDCGRVASATRVLGSEAARSTERLNSNECSLDRQQPPTPSIDGTLDSVQLKVVPYWHTRGGCGRTGMLPGNKTDPACAI